MHVQKTHVNFITSPAFKEVFLHRKSGSKAFMQDGGTGMDEAASVAGETHPPIHQVVLESDG